MVVWSTISKSMASGQLLATASRSPATKEALNNALQLQMTRRTMSDHGPRNFFITPSRFQWHKFKDSMHYAAMLGLIPITALITYVNIFVGPAQLEKIPDGYVPKHWEYHRHPVSRFLARYVYPSPQQEYEKMLHVIKEEEERMALRKIEQEVRAKMSERQDYQSYYYRPAVAKYARISKEVADELEELRGDS